MYKERQNWNDWAMNEYKCIIYTYVQKARAELLAGHNWLTILAYNIYIYMLRQSSGTRCGRDGASRLRNQPGRRRSNTGDTSQTLIKYNYTLRMSERESDRATIRNINNHNRSSSKNSTIPGTFCTHAPARFCGCGGGWRSTLPACARSRGLPSPSRSCETFHCPGRPRGGTRGWAVAVRGRCAS